MAGYLTHVMVLIKAEAWLGHLSDALERRRAAPGACLSDFEEAMLDLARRSRSLLRVDPASAQRLPATQIENGVGSNLSKYALVGSIGMDFPINGYVLALNRDWVSRTMRLGSPRRAYVNADSTLFVLKFFDALNDATLALEPEQQRAMRSYALGHLAGVAADVVLQPAVNSWTWSDQNSDHLDQHRFKVQLDARVAHGFFQRESLRHGQEWEDYFLSSGDVERESEKLTKVFLKSFRDTYGAARPTSGICAGDAAECRVPEITEAFLKDAYANTKNWAIGRGYDQSPWWWYKPVLGTMVVAGGMFAVLFIWMSTASYNVTRWRQGEGFETERLWFDMLSNANTFAGVVYFPFTWLAKFPAFWSGIFGQGTIGSTERPTGKAFVAIFKGILDITSFVFDRILNIAGAADANGAFYTSVDPVVNEPYVRWPRFGVGALLELLKTFWIDMGSAENGEEGDVLSFTMFWPVKVATFGTLFASVLIVFGAKTARKNDDGTTTEDVASGWDYLIGLICPTVFIAITWGTGFFENKVLEKIVGVPWPSKDTGAVDRFLPETTIAPFGNPTEGVAGHRRFTGEGATGFPVSLFEESNGGVVTEGIVRHYAEDANASPWGEVRQRDDAARKLKSTASSKSDYKMAELIDHAAHLAGLLAMAAVNYDGINPRMRDSVKEIFKDWNLDYRTVEEWNALLMEPSGTDRGLLTATAEWWDDLNQNRPSTAPEVLDRVDQEMAVTGFSGKILADFTHTGDTPQSIVSPLQPQARCGRLRRPGAIILPNLNIDEPIVTPVPPLPDRRPRRDAVKDNAIEGLSDEIELTQFRLERPSRAAASAYELTLKIHTDDARRVRVFEVDPADSSPAWPRRFGADVGGANTDRHTIAGAGGGEIDFCVEALTLPGDPLLPAPTGAAPLGPDGVTPVAPSRMKGDVWMELLHRDGSTDLPSLTDIGNFTIAPWLMFSNLQPFQTLFVVYAPGPTGNHPTVADLVEGITAALGAARVPVRTRPVSGGGTEFIAHQPLAIGEPDRADGLYIIDGTVYGPAYADVWIQDEVEIGYCWAPHTWTYMTIHLPRKRPLAAFVHEHIPAADMGLFDSLDQPWSSINYGGNLEVSPPVDADTGLLAEGKAGLAVPAHARAPLGKIILGEGLILLFFASPSIISDLNLGGIPNDDVRDEFLLSGISLPGTEIVPNPFGAGWQVKLDGITDSFIAKLESGRINVYIRHAGSETLAFDLDPSLEPDFVAGGAPSTRLQDAFLENGFELRVPRITVRVTGNEWLITITGQSERMLLLVRKEGGDLRVYEARIADADHRAFLDAQAVQPVVTFDTSWLHVGHVDEVMIFVPSSRDKGFKLLMSSTQLATDIFEAAKALNDPDPVAHPLSALYRGKFWKDAIPAIPPDPAVPAEPAVISVTDLLTDARDFNHALQTERLMPIENRLKRALDLVDGDVVHIPVYYDGKDLDPASIGFGAMTSANTPHMINLQVVDRHLMVPKPFGPRMRVDDVVTVLTGVGLAGVTAARLAPLVGHFHWAKKGKRLSGADGIAATFGLSESSIRSHANNAGKFTGAGAVKNNWDRIWIPEDTVDLLEAFVFIVLDDNGLTIHFIDDWDEYHRMLGEVHCGTNVIRTPPEAASGYSGPYWWDHYHP